jgi:NAD(P)-dependent dehydrogenase (short-subunit alcohol dehydrogenase family)
MDCSDDAERRVAVNHNVERVLYEHRSEWSFDRILEVLRVLQGKVAIVTGGGTGVGEAICRTLARRGAKLVVNGLPGDPIADVAAAILDDGGEAIPFAGDESDESCARACVDAAIEHFGPLDILINNAGVLLVNAETDRTPADKFDEQIRCNMRTAFLMTKFALPHLRKSRGNIICAGSEAGRGEIP